MAWRRKLLTKGLARNRRGDVLRTATASFQLADSRRWRDSNKRRTKMPVPFSSFVGLVDEFTTIRSGLAELLVRLDEFEKLLRIFGKSPAATPVASTVDTEFEDATVAGRTAQFELGVIIASNDPSEMQIECENSQSDLLNASTLDELTAIMAPADTTAVTGIAETHSLATVDGAVDMTATFDGNAIGCSNTACLGSTMPRSEADALTDHVDGQGATLGMARQDKSAFEQSYGNAAEWAVDEGAGALPVPEQAMFAMEHAGKAEVVDAVASLESSSRSPERVAILEQLASGNIALTLVPPATSIIVLPQTGDLARSASYPSLPRIIAAASLIICVVAVAGYQLVNDRSFDILRMAVDGTVHTLPALWQQTEAAR